MLELEKVVAELAIRNLIARLSDSITRRDPVTYAACYAEDAEWDAFGTVTRGRATIVGHWIEVMKGFPFVVQHVNSIVIEVDGDTAASRGYVDEILRMPDGTGKVVVGVYHNTYKKSAGAWLIAVSRYDQIYFGSGLYDGHFFPLMDYGAPPHDPDPSRKTKPMDLSNPAPKHG
jgi:uncharacterized protein (TIGR02246 family)